MNVIERPLTTFMIEVLMDCHEGEFLNLEPRDVSSVRSVSSLIQRGLVTIKPYINKRGKKIYGIYLTNAGRRYLNNM
jgi:hypothetical protein